MLLHHMDCDTVGRVLLEEEDGGEREREKEFGENRCERKREAPQSFQRLSTKHLCN